MQLRNVAYGTNLKDVTYDFSEYLNKIKMYRKFVGFLKTHFSSLLDSFSMVDNHLTAELPNDVDYFTTDNSVFIDLRNSKGYTNLQDLIN